VYQAPRRRDPLGVMEKIHDYLQELKPDLINPHRAE
jgi:hypothetical protein